MTPVYKTVIFSTWGKVSDESAFIKRTDKLTANVDSILNKLVSEGWELVDTNYSTHPGTNGSWIYMSTQLIMVRYYDDGA